MRPDVGFACDFARLIMIQYDAWTLPNSVVPCKRNLYTRPAWDSSLTPAKPVADLAFSTN